MKAIKKNNVDESDDMSGQKQPIYTGSCIRVYTSVYSRARDPLFGAAASSTSANLYRPRILTWDEFASLLQNKVFANPQATVTQTELCDKEAWKAIKLSQRVSILSIPKQGKFVYALAFDYDNIENLEDYEKLLSCVASSQYECLLHTTSSHTEIRPKLHLIFPLRNPIKCSDICYCLCTLIKQLKLPTCFDSSVFIPGQALYLPEERIADGFCEWHKHCATGEALDRFSLSCCGGAKDRRMLLKQYHKYLGASVNHLATYEMPQDVATGENTPKLRKAAATRRAYRNNAWYFKAFKYRDIQPMQQVKLARALSKLMIMATQAIYVAQHDYALEYLEQQAGFSDVVEYRNSSSLYNENKKRLLLLSKPCPKCAQSGKTHIMFGSCYLDSGYARMQCISSNCNHSIEHKIYASKTFNGYRIDAFRFWQAMLEQLQASIVVLKNTSVRFLCVGSTLVPLDLFCSTLHMSFQNVFNIKQILSMFPQCEVVTNDKKYSVKQLTKSKIDEFVAKVPSLADRQTKITNENIFVLRGNRVDFMYQRLLSSNMYPLLIGKLSGSTFATKKKVTLESVAGVVRTASRLKQAVAKGSNTELLSGYVPLSIRKQVVSGGITMISPYVLLSKLRRLPPAVFVTIERHRSKDALEKIRQYCTLAALRGTKVFIIPKIPKGKFFEPAYRVCMLLNIKQTQARSVAYCAKALGIADNFEKSTAQAARDHFATSQEDLVKLKKKVNKPQKQDIEGASHNVESAGSTTALVKEAERSSANATSWGSLVIDL